MGEEDGREGSMLRGGEKEEEEKGYYYVISIGNILCPVRSCPEMHINIEGLRFRAAMHAHPKCVCGSTNRVISSRNYFH